VFVEPIRHAVRGPALSATVRRVRGRAFDPWEAIHDQGGVDLALAFARLFWPVFVERDGCVLLGHRASDEAVSEGLQQAGGDLRKVEELLNRVSLRELMPIEDSPQEDEMFMEVGRTMQRCWTAALAEQFPGREFVVELLGWEEDWHGPTLYLKSAPRPGTV
jgi:hypothetical protein